MSCISELIFPLLTTLFSKIFREKQEYLRMKFGFQLLVLITYNVIVQPIKKFATDSFKV